MSLVSAAQARFRKNLKSNDNSKELLAAKERKERRGNLKLNYMLSVFFFEFSAFFCGQPE
jgi:hypothetical protein